MADSIENPEIISENYKEIEYDEEKESEEELTCLTNFGDDSLSTNEMILSPTLSNSAESVDQDVSVGAAIGGAAKRGRWANRGDHVARVEQIIIQNGKKLYPSRVEKQKMAEEFGISADEVTRIYSNLRRRQPENKLKAKARKRARVTANSPVQIMALSGGLQQVVNENSCISPCPTEQPMNQATGYQTSTSAQIQDPIFGSSTPNQSQFFEEARGAECFENNPNMVALNGVSFNPEYAHIASAIIQQTNNLSEILSSNHEAAKMVLFQPQNLSLLIAVLQQQLQSSGTVNMSAALTQINQLLMQNTLLTTPVGQVVLQQLQNHVKRLGESSISASPNSDSGISDQPEMSPRSPLPNAAPTFQDASTIPYLNQQAPKDSEQRVSSPLFKDPHQLADPEMTKLLGSPPIEAAPKGIFDELTREEREAAVALGQLSIRPIFIFKGSRC